MFRSSRPSASSERSIGAITSTVPSPPAPAPFEATAGPAAPLVAAAAVTALILARRITYT